MKICKQYKKKLSQFMKETKKLKIIILKRIITMRKNTTINILEMQNNQSNLQKCNLKSIKTNKILSSTQTLTFLPPFRM